MKSIPEEDVRVFLPAINAVVALILLDVVSLMVYVPAYRRRARGLRPALLVESRPSGFDP